MNDCAKRMSLAGLAAFGALCAAQAEPSIYPPGVVTQVRGDVATVQLANWAPVIERNTKVAFYTVRNVLTHPSEDKVVVAEIEVRAAVPVQSVTDDAVTVRLRDTHGRAAIAAAPGDGVFFGKEFAVGRQFVVRDDPLSAKIAYKEEFGAGSALGTFWESIPGALNIQGGALTLNTKKRAVRNVLDPHPGDITVKLKEIGAASKYLFNQAELTAGTICVEFDLQAPKGFRIAFDRSSYNTGLIGIDFVVNRWEGMAPGIHVNNRLAADLQTSAQRNKHVAFTVGPTFAELKVDTQKCSTMMTTNLVRGGYRYIVIFADGECTIDNFRIWKLPKDFLDSTRQARIVGYDADREHVAVLKGNEPEWRKAEPGCQVQFVGAGTNVAVQAALEADLGNIVVCRTVKDAEQINASFSVRLNPSLRVQMEKPGPSEPARTGTEDTAGNTFDIQKAKPPADGLTQYLGDLVGDTGSPSNRFLLRPLLSASTGRSVVIGEVGEVQTNGVFHVAAMRSDILPQEGHVYAVAEILAHPVTGTLLGLRLGDGGPAYFTSTPDGVDIRMSVRSSLPYNASEGLFRFFVLTKTPFPQSPILELSDEATETDVMGGRQDFWSVASGDWSLRQGRLVSSSPLDKAGVPMLVSRRAMNGNFEFQFDVIVVAPVRQIFCTYTKDISCLFFSPKGDKGLTFGLGAEGYGGVSYDKGPPGAVSMDGFLRRNKQTTQGSFRGHGLYVGGDVEAKLGTNYTIRIRKIGVQFAMYVTGRRVITVDYPGVDKAVQTWLIAPESILSVADASLRRLPKGSVVLKKDPPLGEFGYVAWADGKDAVVDRMPGLKHGGTVYLAKPVNEIKDPTNPDRVASMDFECAAVGTVTHIGHSLCHIRLTRVLKPVCRGMKVFTRRCEDRFALTGAQLASVDETL